LPFESVHFDVSRHADQCCWANVNRRNGDNTPMWLRQFPVIPVHGPDQVAGEPQPRGDNELRPLRWRVEREGDMENRASLNRVLGPDPASMALDDAFADSQP
jgi:hypothetical protein